MSRASYIYVNIFQESDRRSAKRPRRESCTVLFDWSIQQLIQDVENERSQIERKQEQRLNELADQQSMDQIMAQREGKNEMFIREMKQRHYMVKIIINIIHWSMYIVSHYLRLNSKTFQVLKNVT